MINISINFDTMGRGDNKIKKEKKKPKKEVKK
jgi:hypothetical protein